MTRAALIIALVAAALAGAALTAALHKPANPWTLTCSETFSSNGISRPVLYPCRLGSHP